MSKRERSREEEAYLASYDAGAWPRPSVTIDVVVLTVMAGRLHAVLHRRAEHPDQGRWALPGGFVGLDESLDAAAHRVLAEKGGIEGVFLEQLYTFGAPQRDPRSRVITVAYYALAPIRQLASVLSSESGVCLAPLDVPWSGEHGGPVAARGASDEELPLAFDHADILGMAVLRVRGKLRYAPVAYALLPQNFTLRELRIVHESILGRPLNKDSFRRSLLATGEIEATGGRQVGVGHRPAALYRYTGAASPSSGGRHG